MARAKKTKLTARQRGYFHKSEVAASLRAMASQIDQSHDTSLMKMTLNIWYTPDDELPPEPTNGTESDNRDVEAD